MTEELYVKGPVTPIVSETQARVVPEPIVLFPSAEPSNVEAGDVEKKVKITKISFFVFWYIVAACIIFAIPDLSGFMFWVILIMGLLVGVEFINQMFRSANKDAYNLGVKFFLCLVGVGGGIVIFFISFIIGVTGYLNAHPIQGD